MLEKLLAASEEANGGFHVYTNETMPKRWAFTGHEVRKCLAYPKTEEMLIRLNYRRGLRRYMLFRMLVGLSVIDTITT